MAMNRIQFQPGLSVPEFFQQYGTEAQCEAALEKARWPDGFRCPRCDGAAYYVLRGTRRKLFQCAACRHQSSLIAGTLFQGTKLSLTVWFLAIYLISQAKTGLSALSDEGHPLHTKLTPVPGFSLKAIAQWATTHLAHGSTVFSDGLACFTAVTEAGATHRPTVVAGRKPKNLPEFKWINTVLGNLKTSLSGCYHAFDFQKYATRYLAAFAYRFNRRFNLRTLHKRLLVAAALCKPHPLHLIRAAEDRY